jgi:hypothetical protein
MNKRFKEIFIFWFRPSLNRIIISMIAVYIYHNIYGKIGGGIIPILFFPTFYIAYIFIKYPENLNWRNTNPIIPEEDFITSLNDIFQSKYQAVIIFIIMYILLNMFLYKNLIKIFYKKYIKG